jgi:hypothetical protein
VCKVEGNVLEVFFGEGVFRMAFRPVILLRNRSFTSSSHHATHNPGRRLLLFLSFSLCCGFVNMSLRARRCASPSLPNYSTSSLNVARPRPKEIEIGKKDIVFRCGFIGLGVCLSLFVCQQEDDVVKPSPTEDKNCYEISLFSFLDRRQIVANQ